MERSKRNFLRRDLNVTNNKIINNRNNNNIIIKMYITLIVK